MYHHFQISKIGKAATLEQLAEECTELAHAALKCARILRDENPTPLVYSDMRKKLVEEYSDVVQQARELDLDYDIMLMREKEKRFKERWNEMKGEENGND